MSEEKQALALRNNYIQQLLSEDDYPPGYLERLPEEKQEKVANQVKKVRSGLYSIAPLKCKGPEKCPFIEHCPLVDRHPNGAIDKGPIENYPVGYACVLESAYMKMKTIEYVQHLSVSPDDPIEMAIVNDLCLIDLYKNRATIILSAGDANEQGQDFLRIDTSQVIDTGHGTENMVEVQSVQLHPALEVIEKMEKRRQKLLEQLGETRYQKYKRAEKQGELEKSSRLMAEIEAIKKSLNGASKISTSDAPVIPLKD